MQGRGYTTTHCNPHSSTPPRVASTATALVSLFESWYEVGCWVGWGTARTGSSWAAVQMLMISSVLSVLASRLFEMVVNKAGKFNFSFLELPINLSVSSWVLRRFSEVLLAGTWFPEAQSIKYLSVCGSRGSRVLRSDGSRTRVGCLHSWSCCPRLSARNLWLQHSNCSVDRTHRWNSVQDIVEFDAVELKRIWAKLADYF